MNAPATLVDHDTLGCRELALAALGALLPDDVAGADAAEGRLLSEAWRHADGPRWPQQVARALAAPSSRDAALMRLAALLQLSPAEVLTLALAASVEDDPLVGRLLAWLQAPGGAARPSLALLARALSPLQPPSRPCSDAQKEAALIHALANGPAVRAAALQLEGDDRPLCERTLRMPPALAAALAGIDADWPGAALARPAAPDGLDPALLRRWAQRLAAGDGVALLVRSASPGEAQAAAAALARHLSRLPAWFGATLPPGADLWLALGRRLPVFMLDSAPLEVQTLPLLTHYRGPVLALAGSDGGVRRDDGVLAEWRVGRAAWPQRLALWQSALGDTPAAAAAARRHRASPAQTAEHARLVRLLGDDDRAVDGDGLDAHAAPAAAASASRIAAAARLTAACRALDALADGSHAPVADDALVLGPALRAELGRALQRCEQREGLGDGLGPALRARAGDGVRLLFTGASGTGKTLAAQWLASRLALPLYRVDLSSMLSKWIGETEKNLAEVLARAEAADVVLLFDEADTLFGKRTEVGSANDRFANAQTNYLLQRIETHDGIVVLTSNSRSRFDPAFVRRLDFIVDFPAPDAAARRDLWRAHLGEGTSLDTAQFNRLAALAELAGGHIRNAVLAAAAAAAARGTPLGFDDVVAGVRAEYRKLGRAAPAEL